MNSGISFSKRSAASLMVLPTRAEASSTLRLKSFMILLAILWRERVHAILRMPGSVIIPCLADEVNGRRRIHGAACSGNRYSRRTFRRFPGRVLPCAKIPDSMKTPSHSNGTSAEASFRRLLLAWYDAHARDLPWRKDRDPYRVWVSEIMLQQTRVAAVIEQYHAFLRRFPTVEKLAAARESSVLATWSGLGYYRRARMMHAAAKVIVRELGRDFPATAEALRALPGIGRYTSAAIASI